MKFFLFSGLLLASFSSFGQNSCLELNGLYSPVSIKTGEVSKVDRARIEANCQYLIYPAGANSDGSPKMLRIEALMEQKIVESKKTDLDGEVLIETSSSRYFYRPLSSNQFNLTIQTEGQRSLEATKEVLSSYKISMNILLSQTFDERLFVSQHVLNSNTEDGETAETDQTSFMELKKVD